MSWWKSKPKPKVPPTPSVPPFPPTMLYGHLTVRGADGVTLPGATATLVVDDHAEFSGTSTAGRLQVNIDTRKTTFGWGGTLTVLAPDHNHGSMRVVLKNQVETDPHLEWGEIILVPLTASRAGVVRGSGKAAEDDGGLFHPLGITLFWAMQGWKHDRQRFMENVEFISKYGYDYARILCEVQWDGWEIDPTMPEWADHATVLGEVIDYLYDKGLRTQLTLVGKGTRTDPMALVETAVQVINADRQHKVMFIECANEYFVYDGPSLDTMVRMAQRLRERTVNLVALSAPDGDPEEVEEGTTKATAQASVRHPDREPGDMKWRQVRQVWDFRLSSHMVFNNEPAGPASSVATNDSPLQLAMMRACGVMCGATGYVLHIGAMVTGLGDPARGRPKNIWEVPNIDQIMTFVRAIDRLLPDGVENWQQANTQWKSPNPVSPFQADAHWEGDDDHGVNKAYAARQGNDFIQMLLGVRRYVTLTASYPLHHVTFYDPLTLLPIDGLADLNFASGQSVKVMGRDDSMTAYIIRGQA